MPPKRQSINDALKRPKWDDDDVYNDNDFFFQNQGNFPPFASETDSDDEKNDLEGSEESDRKMIAFKENDEREKIKQDMNHYRAITNSFANEPIDPRDLTVGYFENRLPTINNQRTTFPRDVRRNILEYIEGTRSDSRNRGIPMPEPLPNRRHPADNDFLDFLGGDDDFKYFYDSDDGFV